jgi:hypothetical protein
VIKAFITRFNSAAFHPKLVAGGGTVKAVD